MGKERRSSVTVWLVIWIVGSVINAICYFTGSGIGALLGGNTGFSTAFGIISIINIVCFVLIFNWKFIGVVGIVLTSIIGLVLNFIAMGRIGAAVDTISSGLYGVNIGFSNSYKWVAVIGTVIFLLLFFSVLCKKKDGYSTMDYLLDTENRSKPKPKQGEYNSLLDTQYPERQCVRCGKTIDAGNSACPHCGSV